MENYEDRLPTDPPDGVLEWMIAKGCFKNHYLVYRVSSYRDPLTDMSEKSVQISCSCCHSTWQADYSAVNCSQCATYATASFGFINKGEQIISGQHTICPCCGAETTAVHIGRMRGGRICDEEYCVTVDRVDEKLVLMGWLFQRYTDNHAQQGYDVYPYEAYVVEAKHMVRMVGYEKNFNNICLRRRWMQRKRFADVWGLTKLIYPWDTKLLVGSTAENSKLDLYTGLSDVSYPVTWLRLWQKHPNIENILTSGAGFLVSKMIDNEINMYSCYGSHGYSPKLELVNWKEARPAQMLGLNKVEFTALVRERWNIELLKRYKLVREIETVSMEDVSLLKNYSSYGIRCLVNFDRGGMSVMRILRYLNRQKQIDIQYLLDYWRMASELGEPFGLPKNLVREHDRVLRLHRELEDRRKKEERRKEIEERVQAFHERAKELERFSWHSDGILIRPAADEEELIREGKLLSHCVATYAKSVATGKTAIFFIRKEEAPDEPWYTLELDEQNLTVRQNRGKRNCDRTEDVQVFENAWLKWLRKTTKEKKERVA